MVRAPVPVRGHSHFRSGYPWDMRDSVIPDFRPQTPGTGGTQSLQHTRSPWGLEGLSPFSPPGTLGLPGLSLIGAPGTLWTDRTLYFQSPRYPRDWRDSVLLGLQVPWGLAGLSPFSVPGILGIGGTKSFQGPRCAGD